MEKHRQQFLKMESTPGEDPMEIDEMTIKDLEYCINLTDKRAEDLRGLTPVLKYCQTALHATEKAFMKERVNWCGELHCCCFILRNCHGHPSLQQPPP